MGGAAIMAAEAAMRSGAGLVTVVTQPEHQPALLARLPEAMFMSQIPALGEAISAADFIVIGPGLGRGEWGNNLFAQTATRTAPMLVDADGLYWLKNSDHQPATPVVVYYAPRRRSGVVVVDLCGTHRSRSYTGGQVFSNDL